MGDKRNIDRIFQEKFKDFEVFPETHVWKGIEKELVKKRKRRVVPLWMRFAGAAAILIAFISVGTWFYNNNDTKNNSPNTITNTDNSEKNKGNNSDKEEQLLNTEKNNNPFDKIQTKETLITTKQESDQQNSTIQQITQNNERVQNGLNNKTKNNNIVEVQKMVSQQKINEHLQDKKSNAIEIAEKPQNLGKENLALTDVEKPTKNPKKNILEEVREQENIEELLETNTKKWAIGSTTGPVYMNSLEGSPIDPSLENNSKNSKGSLSYGIKVNYKLSDKFSLQSGIQNIDLAYSTSNVTVIVTSSLLDQSNTNINFNIKGASAQVLSNDMHIAQASEVSQIPFRKQSPFNNSGNLEQRLSYIEVPLEAKYALVQKKLAVNLVGGFSTYFLYGNDVSMSSLGKNISLGEASNVNDLNFSGNVGIDLNYNISPNLYINTSPMLKYQLNTYSENAGGFKPYFFGVYVGVNFRF